MHTFVCTKYDFNSITMLINGNSASASEALTLCLEYYKDQLNHFQIVGTKSYGKGIAQTSINLSNGGTLNYTFAKVYNPGGDKSIHKEGIVLILVKNPVLPLICLIFGGPFGEA